MIILSSEEATTLAVGMLWGKKGVRSFDIPKPDIKEPDEVLVRVKEAGLDGTDFNIKTVMEVEPW